MSDIYGNLSQAIKNCKAVKFGDFKLTNGKNSRYYVDIKKVSTKPKILKMISYQISRLIQIHGIETNYISCVEMGGITIATAVSLDTDLPLIIVRKADKDHGITDRIVGDYEKGKSVLFVEDVVSTGGSSVSAIQVLKSQGLSVKHVICVVDREEGGEDSLSKIGVALISLVKAKELLKVKGSTTAP